MVRNAQGDTGVNDNKSALDQDEWTLDTSPESPLFSGEEFGMTSKTGRELEDYIDDIGESVRIAMDQSVSILTPWFFSNMPQFYYQTTPRSEKVRDLHAIITGHIFESKQKLQLWNRDRSKVTHLAPGNEEGIFHEIAKNVLDQKIKHGTMFTSNDRLLLIASFFTSAYKPVDLNNPLNAKKVEQAHELLKDDSEEEVHAFMKNLDDDMVVRATPVRMARLFKLHQQVKNREDAVTHLVPEYYHDYARLDIAYKKMPIERTLYSILYLFDRYGFQVNRCMVAALDTHTTSPVTVLTFIIRHFSSDRINEKFVPFLKVRKAVTTLRWVDSDQYDELIKPDNQLQMSCSLNEVNLIRSISVWVQIFLSKLNPYYYSEERIRKTFYRNAGLVQGLIDLFRVRFDPRFSGDRQAEGDKLLADLDNQIRGLDNRIEHDIMQESVNFLSHILKTNYFYPRKTGLAFRMDPKCLNHTYYPNTPYGFFYMMGRGYRGFHVRYRDTARGGLRIVMPREMSQYEANLVGLFDEVIGLAYAQQLKNKDIPEGGAKAVLLLAPGADRETAAIGAVDSLLNLITVNKKTNKLAATIIDHLGLEENIYLGPDENCTNELINDFVKLAMNQGYRYPNAFMSSKPEAGINHKEFGVTSEGVNVYLDNMLQELGIKGREQDFTVKMTGGPDGDVAGNELKILHREYGDHAKVVAIADGYGAAYDPEGLSWKELIRLVEEQKPISAFNKDCLSGSKEAFVILADTKERTRIRNNLYATVKADIFIPAGGRPYTVNNENWSGFLQENGEPSARAIVEGANIFFTDEAREHLQEAGVLIFKDSSANKCGVICSSFEIISSLILSPEEFLEIKPVYVAQVLEKLRQKADLEAKLLLKEYHERGKTENLVELSKVLSAVINRVTDLVSVELDKLSDEEFARKRYTQLILNYVPVILKERYEDRILNVIPRSYRQAIISADIAARVVYAEGTSWLASLPDEAIITMITTYMSQMRKVAALLEGLEKSDLEDKETIIRILSKAGARTLTQLSRDETN